MKRFLVIFIIMCIFSSVCSVNADNIDREIFIDMVKEYAYKLVVPEIRFKDKMIHAEDMGNLRSKIKVMIEDYSGLRGTLIDIIKNDDEIGSILNNDSFSSDLIKYENLNNMSLNLPEKVENVTIRANKITLILKYARHFNLEPKPEFLRKLKKYNFSNKKVVMDEYIQIIEDVESITDEVMLKKIGPSIISRCRDILTRENLYPTKKDDVLPDIYASKLFRVSGNLNNSLKYGLNPTEPIEGIVEEFIKHVDSIYVNVKIPSYKFSTLDVIAEAHGILKRYEDFLKYLLYVKDDTYYLFSANHKMNILVYICDLIKNDKIPINNKYYNEGYNSSIELLNVVDYHPDLPEKFKYVYKLDARRYFTVEILKKHKYYDEALFELEYIIKSKPPTDLEALKMFNKTVERCKKKKEEILPNAQYFPNLNITMENENDPYDPEKPVVWPDGETVRVYATPFKLNQDDKDLNIQKIKLKFNGKKQNTIQNLKYEISYEEIFEDEVYIKNFLKSPMNKDEEAYFMHHRGDYGLISENNQLVSKLSNIEFINDEKSFKFKHSYFGGDKFKIKIKFLPPYNVVKDKTVILEVWKKFTLRLYGMNESLYPKVSLLKNRFNRVFIEFDIKQKNHNVKYVKEIIAEHNGNLNSDQILYKNYLDILKDDYDVDMVKQNDYLNVIGVDNVFPNMYEKDAFGKYTNYYTSEEGNIYINTAMIGYGKLSENSFYDPYKTFSHEIGHAFALEHAGLNEKMEIKTYKHVTGKDCIMLQGQSVNTPNTNKQFCKNCQILLRNGKINIDIMYHTHGVSKGNK